MRCAVPRSSGARIEGRGLPRVHRCRASDSYRARVTDEVETSTKVRMRSWVSGRVGVKRMISRVASVGYVGAKKAGLARYPLRVQRYAFTPPGWTPGLRLSVAVIADPHFGGVYVDEPRLRQILELTAGLEPDLILLLGDYGASGLEGVEHRAAMTRLSAALAGLTSPLGTYAIVGNHDWWDDPEAQRAGHGPVIAAQELDSAGITVLENQAVQLTHGGYPFWLAGLGDQLAHLGPPVSGDDDLTGLTAQLTDGAPALLLAHEPDLFPQVPARYALTLSGHTHGGQIRVFGRTPVVPSRFGSRYVYGHVVEDGRHLIVSGGLGTSLLPVRIGSRPEVVHLRLG